MALTVPRLEHWAQRTENKAAPVYLPQAKYLRLMSLGYHNVLADVLWFRTISYFGKHYRGDRSYRWLAYMCDLVTDLDPRAEHVYRFGGMILPWEAAQADNGIRILEKGIGAFPHSWLLHYWTGFTYYFFKNDLATAAEYLKRAAQLPEAHPSAGRLAALLASEHYGPETTLRFLAELRDDVDTPEMREVVNEHLREAQLASALERLNRALDSYRQRHGRTPTTLASLVDDGLIDSIPQDPFGGTYEIDPESGEVHSSTGHKPSALHQSGLRARYLRGESVRDF